MNTSPAPSLNLDRQWMQRALELAQRGIGLCSPNPVVGCVILDSNGKLCGEGWHEYERRDHAEVAALRNAAERAQGGTAYITLEPCNHTGRTPPCTQALIRAGVKRVVAATIDPNPHVAGHGMDALRAACIQTEIGICQTEARRLNEGFARWSQSKRPFVLLKVAMSLDGRIAPPGSKRVSREPVWITGSAARQAVQQLRLQADAILTGVDTVLADDPLLTDRSGQRRRRPLLRVLLDSYLRLPLDSKLVTTAQNDVLVFTVSPDKARVRELAERGVRTQVLSADQGRVPLGTVLDTLGGEGILTLLTETGSRLNTALLTSGLVDRVQLFVAPNFMGADALPAFDGIDNPIDMDTAECERLGDDLSLTSLLHDPWQKSGTGK